MKTLQGGLLGRNGEEDRGQLVLKVIEYRLGVDIESRRGAERPSQDPLVGVRYQEQRRHRAGGAWVGSCPGEWAFDPG